MLLKSRMMNHHWRGPWRYRFAWFPIPIGESDDNLIIWLWLQPYESRQYGTEDTERRALIKGQQFTYNTWA